MRSRGGNRYIFVIVDDFSRYTWTIFLSSKDQVFDEFEAWVKVTKKMLGVSLVSIRFDHGTEFENS